MGPWEKHDIPEDLTWFDIAVYWLAIVGLISLVCWAVKIARAIL